MKNTSTVRDVEKETVIRSMWELDELQKQTIEEKRLKLELRLRKF